MYYKNLSATSSKSHHLGRVFRVIELLLMQFSLYVSCLIENWQHLMQVCVSRVKKEADCSKHLVTYVPAHKVSFFCWQGRDSHLFIMCPQIFCYCCSVFFFFFIYFYQLEANYFTILQWFLSYIDMNQPWIYMYSPSQSPPHFPFYLIPLPSTPGPSTCLMHPTWCPQIFDSSRRIRSS